MDTEALSPPLPTLGVNRCNSAITIQRSVASNYDTAGAISDRRKNEESATTLNKAQVRQQQPALSPKRRLNYIVTAGAISQRPEEEEAFEATQPTTTTWYII
jgi:hypothetical protein